MDDESGLPAYCIGLWRALEPTLALLGQGLDDVGRLVDLDERVALSRHPGISSAQVHRAPPDSCWFRDREGELTVTSVRDLLREGADSSLLLCTCLSDPERPSAAAAVDRLSQALEVSISWRLQEFRLFDESDGSEPEGTSLELPRPGTHLEGERYSLRAALLDGLGTDVARSRPLEAGESSFRGSRLVSLRVWFDPRWSVAAVRRTGPGVATEPMDGLGPLAPLAKTLEPELAKVGGYVLRRLPEDPAAEDLRSGSTTGFAVRWDVLHGAAYRGLGHIVAQRPPVAAFSIEGTQQLVFALASTDELGVGSDVGTVLESPLPWAELSDRVWQRIAEDNLPSPRTRFDENRWEEYAVFSPVDVAFRRACDAEPST